MTAIGRGTRAIWRTMVLVVLCAILASGLSACSTPFSSSGRESSTADACLDAYAVDRPVTTGVFVEPEDGVAPLITELDAARCTIDLAVYILTDDRVISALERAIDRGVRVRVVLEEHPYGGSQDPEGVAQRLRDLGASVQWSDSAFQFTHAKYLVIDRETAIIMSLNLTRSAFSTNREFAVVTTEPTSVSQAQTIFDRDWGRDRKTVDGPLIVSPSTSRTRFLALIRGATTSIDLYAEVIRDAEIMTALEEAVDRGIVVRLILNAPASEDDQQAIDRLRPAGIQIRIATTYYIHAKLLLIDDTGVVIGSQNYTATSLDDNRELAMWIEDPVLVQRCVAVYTRDWESSLAISTMTNVSPRSLVNAMTSALNANQPLHG